MKRVLPVSAPRLEPTKISLLMKEFQKHPGAFKTVVCATGQHREMLD